MAAGPSFGQELAWWQTWRRETGEPEPDYAALPSQPFLPPLLVAGDGPIATEAAWRRRRPELWQELSRWFFGSLPPEPPRLVSHAVRREEQTYGTRRRQVDLTFDAGGREVTFQVELLLPEPPPEPAAGAAPRRPLFVTQSTHRSWAAVAASRGYLALLVPAADDDDQSERFVPCYPEADWTTIPRRAWLVGRALDYALALPEVEPEQVGITGHSRNGKLSLIAAAMDPRLTAVVSSSAGTMGTAPYRLVSEAHCGESIEVLLRAKPDWFHPRGRFFIGREDRLPVDVHALLALIAPRPCLLSGALNDHCESVFATERAYEAAREVYALLAAADQLRLRWRAGGHETRADDVEAYLDWFDHVFGRGPSPLPAHQELYTAFSWHAWREAQAAGPRQGRGREAGPATDDAPPAPLPWPAERDASAAAVRWGLGEQPPLVAGWGGSWQVERGYVAGLMRRDRVPEGVTKVPVQFSEYLTGDLYHPAAGARLGDRPLPVVIWLHPYNSTMGYLGRQPAGEHLYHRLARAGYAVFAFDQLGCGRRVEEGGAFYRRHPRWSKLGKLVRDVAGIVDVLDTGQWRWSGHAGRPAPRLPVLALHHIYLVGFNLGAWVGLFSAALDPRVAGLAAFCSVTPLRSRRPGTETDALERLARWYGLLPRLGHFSGRAEEVPFDLEHLLALVAPRPCLLVAPTHDRFVDHEALAASVARAREAYAALATFAGAGSTAAYAAAGSGRAHAARSGDGGGAGDALLYETPTDYNRFHGPQHERVLAWLQARTGR